MDPETAAMVNPTTASCEKKALAGRLTHLAHRALDRISDEKLDNCSAPQLALVGGIAVDKMQVVEQASLRGVNSRDTVGAVLDELQLIRQRRLELQSVSETVDVPPVSGQDSLPSVAGGT